MQKKNVHDLEVFLTKLKSTHNIQRKELENLYKMSMETTQSIAHIEEIIQKIQKYETNKPDSKEISS